jgi:hypothetical protein
VGSGQWAEKRKKGSREWGVGTGEEKSSRRGAEDAEEEGKEVKKWAGKKDNG